MLEGTTDDVYLGRLIDLVVDSIVDNRPLFPDLFKEPIFYRKHFKRWVKDGIAERAAAYKDPLELGD
jgi:hypothetical protein